MAWLNTEEPLIRHNWARRGTGDWHAPGRRARGSVTAQRTSRLLNGVSVRTARTGIYFGVHGVGLCTLRGPVDHGVVRPPLHSIPRLQCLRQVSATASHLLFCPSSAEPSSAPEDPPFPNYVVLPSH